MKKGNILKKYRVKENLTQGELAEKLNVSIGYISNIETSKKPMSKKIENFLVKEGNLSKEELKILNTFKSKKLELLEKEKILNQTYSFIRENNNILSKVASIQNELIDLNNCIDSKINNIELSMTDSEFDLEVLTKLRRPFKTTIKRLEEKIKKFENMLSTVENITIEKEKKMDEFEYLKEYMPPFTKLKKEHKELAVQTWIAKNFRYRWKDYSTDEKGAPTAYSERLWGGGRGKQGKKSYMKNNVEEDFKLQTFGAESIEEFEDIVREVGGTLIERSVVVAEMLLKEARNAKTDIVRKKYNMIMHNRRFLIDLLRICVHLYALEILDKGPFECLSLKSKVKASIECKSKLKSIWRAVSRGDLDFEEALQKSNNATDEFERLSYTDDEIKRIGFERMMMEIAGEERIKDYMHEIMDKMVQRMSGELKLFDTKGQASTKL